MLGLDNFGVVQWSIWSHLRVYWHRDGWHFILQGDLAPSLLMTTFLVFDFESMDFVSGIHEVHNNVCLYTLWLQRSWNSVPRRNVYLIIRQTANLYLCELSTMFDNIHCEACWNSSYSTLIFCMPLQCSDTMLLLFPKCTVWLTYSSLQKLKILGYKTILSYIRLHVCVSLRRNLHVDCTECCKQDSSVF